MIQLDRAILGFWLKAGGSFASKFTELVTKVCSDAAPDDEES